MDRLTLDQAARESGHSARELRLTIESGDLPAVNRGGRWVVDPVDLRQLVEPETSPETRAVEVATLREKLASRGNGESGKVERLERELSVTLVELEQARRRVEQLERDGDRAPGPRQQGMRDALTPLFERTRSPDGER